MDLSRRSICLTFVVALFLSAVPARTAEIIDLGTLGGTSSRATAVNNARQVVGFSTLPGSFGAHAFLYSAGHMQDLGTIGGGISSMANAINNSGEVVGQTDIQHAPGYYGAFKFTKRDGMKQLGSLNPFNSSGSADDINDSGQITGSTTARNGQLHAFLYTPQMGMVDLGTLNGVYSSAAAINNAGEIVGSSGHAFLYKPGAGITDLGTLGGDFSSATAINNAGQVVGSSFTQGDANLDAFLYDPGAGMADIGSFQANAINNRGEVVGSASGTAIFYSNGRIIDLNTLLPADAGWQLEAATGINDSGDIVGYGEINGATHAFLLDTSVPEPTPVALVGTGLLGLGWISKKFRRW